MHDSVGGAGDAAGEVGDPGDGAWIRGGEVPGGEAGGGGDGGGFDGGLEGLEGGDIGRKSG